MSAVRGRQIEVYLHPSDYPSVDAFVHAELDSVILDERSSTGAPKQLNATGAESLQTFICPRELLDKLQPRHITPMKYWVIGAADEPLIEWWHPPLSGNAIYPGRFYYVPKTDSEEEKDNRFLDVADKLFRWVRKSTVTVETDSGNKRLGAHAAELFKNGMLQVRRNPPGSSI